MWKREENFEINASYFLDDTVDEYIAGLWRTQHYEENGEPTDDAVEHALFLDPPE